MIVKAGTEGMIVADRDTSTHPSYHGAKVRVITPGFPANDERAWMMVELAEQHNDFRKGEQIEIRARDFRVAQTERQVGA